MTPKPPSFVCPRCGAESFHPRDLAERYCGRCHIFVDDLATPMQERELRQWADAPLAGDEGLMFSALITKPDGTTLHQETRNRLTLLEWVEIHAAPTDALTVQTEATGATARATLSALAYGATRLTGRPL